MKNILYYATAGMVGLFIGLAVTSSTPNWNCGDGEVVNDSGECQSISTLTELAQWRNSSNYYEECNNRGKLLLDATISYGLLLSDSYVSGYYFDAYDEGVIDSSVDTINSSIDEYNSYCLNDNSIEAL